MGYKGFNTVELRRPQRSTFDLSHDKRLTMQMGYLYPILVQECLPTDSFRGNTDCLVRLMPLLAPIYDQIQVFLHFFFVPNRLLYLEWEKFITGGQFGLDIDQGANFGAPTVPHFNVEEVLGVNPTAFGKSDLSDYLGIPLLNDMPDAPHGIDWSLVSLDCLPFCAYQKIWFDYYRDRNFVADDAPFTVPMPLPSGEVPIIADWEAEYMTLRSRAYKHDYFTSALPWPQRGADSLIPLSIVSYLTTSEVRDGGDAIPPAGGLSSNVGGGLTANNPGGPVGAKIQNIAIAPEYGDGLGTGTYVNDFRTAYALQVWLERNAIGGSRYNESIEAHWGLKPQDARLQRAEYIGGGMLNIKINEVVATAWSESEPDVAVPQGNMAGHGIGFGNGNFSWFCPEHGFIMGIMSIVNPPSYHQGLPRYFRRRTFLDYPFPTFAKLGEQEVYNWEIYASSFQLTSTDGDDTGTIWPVFGYQSRYSDWKYARNTSHGDFHDTLLFWTLTSDYGVTPILSNAFVEFNPLIEQRIFAAPTIDNFLVYLHNKVTVKRPLPYFGTPNTLGFQ